MSKCVNCLKEINEKEVFCLTCHEEVLECAKKKIADLEAKLAEKQKENATLEAMLVENANDRKTMQEFKIGEDGYDLTDEDARNSLCWEVEELKQQLQEKEEEIAYLTKQVKKFNNEAQKYFEDAYCNDFHNQDKISFCIEKLEKVKKLMRNIDMPNKPELYNNDMFGAGFDSHYIRVEKIIDNQIKQLKGENQ